MVEGTGLKELKK